MELRGKVVVVTGASSGIGETTARAFARAGSVVVLAARGEDDLKRVTASIQEHGGQASWFRCDVTSVEDIDALRDHVEATHGRCDVLVNNAGIPGGGWFEGQDAGGIDAVVQTNLSGVIQCTRAFLPLLIDARGHVVNVGSLAGRYAVPGAAVYTATKHAVIAFSEALYHELRPKGVMVTSVNPGLVATRGFPQTEVSRDPMLRRFVMAPERVAGAILHAVRQRKGPEWSVPRWLAAGQAARILAPPLYRRALGRIVRRGRGAPTSSPDLVPRRRSITWKR